MAGRRFAAIKRVSRRKGREGEAFHSDDDQVEIVEAWAERNGDTIAQWFDETDSVSGKTLERKGLKAAMSMTLAGKFDGIAVSRVDRFGRNADQGSAAIRQLRKAGKTFVAVKEGIDDDTHATPTGRLMLGMLLLIAEWNLESITDYWDGVGDRITERGIPTYTKFGYVKDETKRLVPDPEESRWIIPIFERRAGLIEEDGVAKQWTWRRIAEWLTAEGVKSRGDGWGISSVKQIVESRIYLGEISNGPNRVKRDAHKALVSLDLWTRANRSKTTGGRRNKAAPFLLTSVIRCASCGVRMRGNADRRANAAGGEVVYRTYRCAGRHGSWGRCSAPARVSADEIEALVDAEFRAAFLGDRVAVPAEATDEVEAAEDQLKQVQAELDQLYVDVEAGEVSPTIASRSETGLLKRREEARERLSEARSAALGVALPKWLAEAWEGFTTEQRKPYIADGINIVAVKRGQEPADERVKVWKSGDPSAPDKLPGLNGCNELIPIEW